jgi:hypothetical protein
MLVAFNASRDFRKTPQCNSKASRSVSSMRDLNTVELCDTHYKCVIAWVDE